MHRISRFALLTLTAAFAAACSKSPEYYLQSGNNYAAQKKYQEAIVEYRSAIAKNPRLGPAHEKLAEVLLENGEAGNALREYSRAADLEPDNLPLQVKTSQYLLMAGRFDDARGRAQKVLDKDPKNVEAQVVRGNALAGLKDLDGAIADMEDAAKLDGTRAITYSNLGVLQLAKGQREEAEASFKHAVETDPKSLRAYLALANYYWAVGDIEAAGSAFTKGLALSPRDIMANRAYAMFLMSTNRRAEAEAPLKVAAEANGDAAPKIVLADYYVATGRPADAERILKPLAEGNTFATATLRLAAIAYRGNDKAGARRLVGQVLAKQPKNTPAMLLEAGFLQEEGKADQALAMAKDAAAANPRAADAQVTIGVIEAGAHHVDEAIAAYAEALKLAPRAVGPQLALAELYLSKGDAKSAAQFAGQAAQLSRTIDPHLLLARALIASGDLNKAQDEVNGLVRSAPNSPRVQTVVGLLAMKHRDTAAAARAFQTALNADPKDREALAGLVALDLGSKNAAHAVSRLDEQVASHPDDASLQFMLANARLASNDLAGAEAALKKVVTLDPSALQAYAMLGGLYARQHRLDDAIAEFDRAAARDPKAVGPRTAAAMIAELQKRPDDARKRYEQVLSLDPRAAVAANNLAWMYAESGGNLDVALQLAQTAKAQLPDLPEVADTLGWIYYKKGLTSLAVEPLRLSVEKKPDEPMYEYHLGLVLAAQGDSANARKALEHALSLNANFAGSADARRVLASLKG